MKIYIVFNDSLATAVPRTDYTWRETIYNFFSSPAYYTWVKKLDSYTKSDLINKCLESLKYIRLNGCGIFTDFNKASQLRLPLFVEEERRQRYRFSETTPVGEVRGTLIITADVTYVASSKIFKLDAILEIMLNSEYGANKVSLADNDIIEPQEIYAKDTGLMYRFICAIQGGNVEVVNELLAYRYILDTLDVELHDMKLPSELQRTNPRVYNAFFDNSGSSGGLSNYDEWESTHKAPVIFQVILNRNQEIFELLKDHVNLDIKASGYTPNMLLNELPISHSKANRP